MHAEIETFASPARWLTRTPIVTSQIFRMTSVPTIASTQAMPHADQLVQHLPGVAVHQAQRHGFAGGILQAVVDRVGGEDAGEDRAQRSAGAVDAEGIQRVVVAELVLSPCVTIK